MTVKGKAMTSEVANADLSAVAVRQTIALLGPDVDSNWNVEKGHIDLLGERDPIGPSPMQQAMRSKVVSRIYERLWRPLASRSFYGMFGPGKAREQRIALSMLEISADDIVLDVGCGPGNFSREFSRIASDGLVVGLDASETMLAVATKRQARANLSYVKGDAAALPFQAEKFDVVSCFGTIHLVEEPMLALDEMVRVLAPGGRLGLIATWNRKGPGPTTKKGVRVFGREELIDALVDRGLIEVEQRVWGWGQFVSARKPRR